MIKYTYILILLCIYIELTMGTMLRHARSDLRPPNSNSTMFSVALKSADKVY